MKDSVQQNLFFSSNFWLSHLFSSQLQHPTHPSLGKMSFTYDKVSVLESRLSIHCRRTALSGWVFTAHHYLPGLPEQEEYCCRGKKSPRQQRLEICWKARTPPLLLSSNCFRCGCSMRGSNPDWNLWCLQIFRAWCGSRGTACPKCALLVFDQQQHTARDFFLDPAAAFVVQTNRWMSLGLLCSLIYPWVSSYIVLSLVSCPWTNEENDRTLWILSVSLQRTLQVRSCVLCVGWQELFKRMVGEGKSSSEALQWWWISIKSSLRDKWVVCCWGPRS